MIQTRHILYLLDFGLVRKFMKEDGTLRPKREKVNHEDIEDDYSFITGWIQRNF